MKAGVGAFALLLCSLCVDAFVPLGRPPARLTPLARSGSLQRRASIRSADSGDDDASGDDAAAAPEDTRPSVPPQRETAEEAWARAEEGSFLSPALVVGLVLTSLVLKVVVLGGESPF